jgi:hypothetical protein
MVRRLLGPRAARYVGRVYRSIFADLDKQADVIATLIPRSAHILDVGGGDGEPINRLLRVRPDIRVTTLDPAVDVGQWIDERFNGRVCRLSRTSLVDYLRAADREPEPDVLLLSDVIHHVAVPMRTAFLSTVGELLQKVPNLLVIVKDVEPGHWRSRLGYWSDRFVTGDRDVSLVSRQQLIRLLEDALGPLELRETELYALDQPNYAIAFGRRLLCSPS